MAGDRAVEADLLRVIRYLQRGIRENRRTVGALKLSNLLQIDRFEEDLNISRAQLYGPRAPKTRLPRPFPAIGPKQSAAARQRALKILAQFRAEPGM